MPTEGIEPPTFGLQNRCSTAELIRPAGLRYQRVGAGARIASCAGRLSSSRAGSGQRFLHAGPLATVAIGSVIAAAGLVIAVARPGLPTGVAGFALVGAGLSNVVPVIFSAAGRAGSTPAVGIASAATAGYAGLLLGPVVVGGMAAVADLRTAIAMLALVTLLASALAFSRIGGLGGRK